MISLWTDFNALSETDQAWLLFADGKPLVNVANVLSVSRGDRVRLFQDADDFHVEAELDFGAVSPPAPSSDPRWFARIDWKTRVDL